MKLSLKLHKAITDVIGLDGVYKLSCNIPYLDAVIWEIQRYCTIVPGAVPHCIAPKDKQITLAGHVVPNDAIYIFNLYAVHHNKSTWRDPENFRPERYLDENGKFIKNPQAIPFGLGKRSCVGELLARQELYVFTANLFQKFRFLPPEGVERVSENPVFGFTRMSPHFNVRAIPR